jgi:ubiquitin carboxyl-terminal hydrolase 36/42
MKLISFSNLGNTCYINSVLQCFIYNDCFQKYHNLKDLEKVIEQIDLHNHGQMHLTCSIPGFINFFFDKKKSFKRFQQNDAHEFLIEFLDILINNCVEKSLDEYTNFVNEHSFISWNTFLKNNKYSPFLKNYHGQTKLNITCSCCLNTKEVFEEFNTINLNVENKSSVTNLFINYLKKETISDNLNLYYCEHCKSEQVSDRKISLSLLPDVLIITLKRYTYENKNFEVVYDENIKIKDHESIKSYHLSSVIHHIGGLHDGHYSTSVKINGIWYHIDDDSVSVCTKTENAYILFYNKV